MLKCRSCDSDQLISIIPLNELPLANALLSKPTANVEPRYNLEVMLCPSCGLAQLKDILSPADLFSDYVYFSSNSDLMLSSVASLVERILPTLPKNPFVIEIASNDGYLLKNYVKANVPVLGIDPAQNITKIANEKGIPTLCDFFGEELALKLAAEGKKADIIHANNVMAHVPDLNGFIKGLKALLKPQGHAIIEVPYFLDLVQKLEFDTIYHEHIYYFSVHALRTAFARQGLTIGELEKIALHGGTLRLFVCHEGHQSEDALVQKMIDAEEEFGLHQAATYTDFMRRLNLLKDDIQKTLTQLKSSGARIAAYGASAKGTTLLNYFKIGSDLIDFVVDRSPVKKGKFTPGTQLEIHAPSQLLNKQVTHAVLLAWNFADEIMAQQHEYVANGGKFILPLPEVKIVA